MDFRTAFAPAALARRSGLAWGLRSYWLMVRWDIATLRIELPIVMIIQILFGAGTVVGLGLLFDDIPTTQALYFATGGTVLTMTSLGLIMAPQTISQGKAMGWYDYLLALPIPRMMMMLATLTVYMVVAIPGIVVALVAAVLRYDIELAVSPMVVPVALLVLLTATSLGFALGHVSPSPVLTNAITNVLIFFIFLFSPINFPSERLPGWFQAVHEWLPFEHAANAMRISLTDELGSDMGRSMAVLVVWAAVALTATYWVLRRRR